MRYSQATGVSSDVVEQIFSSYEEEDEEEKDEEVVDDGFPNYSYDHETALSINSDTQGLLYMESLSIQLPVVQGTDNSYYLKHLIDGTYNSCGTLFIDANIEDGINASHVIIYGHHLNNGSMFSNFTEYTDQSFYETEGNDVFYLFTDEYVRQYTIYTIYYTETQSEAFQYNFSSLELLRSYGELTKSWSFYDTGVDISQAEQIVTLSTCSVSYHTTTRLLISGVLTAEKELS